MTTAGPLARGWATWERFWFAEEATSSLAVLRIVFGVVVLVWSLSLAGDLQAFFSTGGLLRGTPGGRGVWGVLGLWHSDLAIQSLYGVLVLASLALIVGLHTRLAALLVFVAVLSFERRNPFVFNTGDGLLRLIAFYLMLAPAGTSLSIDRLRLAREHFWEFPARSVWPLRLMQIQLSVLYISGLWVKLQGITWYNGTAVSYAMRISDLSRFPMPTVLTHSPLIANLMTFGTLAVELAVPLLVWNRRLRPYVLLVGVGLHLGIEYSIRVGFFSLMMLTLYLSFLDADWTSRQLLALRERWDRRGGRAARLASQET